MSTTRHLTHTFYTVAYHKHITQYHARSGQDVALMTQHSWQAHYFEHEANTCTEMHCDIPSPNQDTTASACRSGGTSKSQHTPDVTTASLGHAPSDETPQRARVTLVNWWPRRYHNVPAKEKQMLRPQKKTSMCNAAFWGRRANPHFQRTNTASKEPTALGLIKDPARTTIAVKARTVQSCRTAKRTAQPNVPHSSNHTAQTRRTVHRGVPPNVWLSPSFHCCNI